MMTIRAVTSPDCWSVPVDLQAFTLLLVISMVSTEVHAMVEVTRHHNGDYFAYRGSPDENCQQSCHEKGATSVVSTTNSPCRCQCQEASPSFREDVMECLADIEECDLADFSRHNSETKIPFIFMPHKGQLVHPSAQIALQGATSDGKPITSPICAVSDAQYLTINGWMRLANTSENGFPFRLYRDSGKTYLQWLGSTTQRRELEGRLVLVYLLCKESSEVNGTYFSPCVGFRVAGITGESALLDSSKGLVYDEYLIIGLTVGALIVAYIIAVVIYIFTKRRRKRQRLENDGGYLESAIRRSDKRFKSTSKFAFSKHSLLVTPDVKSNRKTNSKSGKSPKYQKKQLETVAGVQSFDIDVKEGEDGDPDSTKSKLVFDPNYFEIDLLKAPPPAAEEFLERIREMIDNARDRLKSKRFEPSLIGIPENEDATFPPHVYYNQCFTLAEEDEEDCGLTFTVNPNKNISESRNEYVLSQSLGSKDSSKSTVQDWLEKISSESTPDNALSSHDPISNPERELYESASVPKDPNILDTGVFLNPGFFKSPRLHGRSSRATFNQDLSKVVDPVSDAQIVSCSAKIPSTNTETSPLDPIYEKGQGGQHPPCDDFLNNLLTSAEAKVPKLHSSDSETHSDTQASNDGYVDSLRVHRQRKHQKNGKRETRDAFSTLNSQNDVEDGINTLSDPSGVSRIIIKENDDIINKLTIEVTDSLSDYTEEEDSYDADTLERNDRKKVERNDSFLQDSLERPSKYKGKRKGRTNSYPGTQGVRLVGANITYSASGLKDNNSSIYVIEPSPRYTDSYEPDSLTLPTESLSHGLGNDITATGANRGDKTTFKNCDTFRSLGRSNSGIEIRTVVKTTPVKERSEQSEDRERNTSGELLSKYLSRNQLIDKEILRQKAQDDGEISGLVTPPPEDHLKSGQLFCDTAESGVDSGKDSDSIPPSPEVLTWDSRVSPQAMVSQYTCKRSYSMDSGHSDESPPPSSEEDVDISSPERIMNQSTDRNKLHQINELPTYKFGDNIERSYSPQKFSRSLSYNDEKTVNKSVLNRLRNLERESFASSDVSQGMIIALNLRSKLEEKYGKDFEKYLGDKNTASSIKRKWRKITRSESDLDIIMREGRLVRYQSNDSINSDSSFGMLKNKLDECSSLQDSSELKKRSKLNNGIKLLVKMFEDPRRQQKSLRPEYTSGSVDALITMESCDNNSDISTMNSRSAENLLYPRPDAILSEDEPILDSLEPIMFTNR